MSLQVLKNVTIGLQNFFFFFTRFLQTRFLKEGHFPIQFGKKGKRLINLPKKGRSPFCPPYQCYTPPPPFFILFLEAKCFSLAYLFREFTSQVLNKYLIQYLKKLVYLLQSKSTICFLRLAKHKMNESYKREQLRGYGLNTGGVLAKGLLMPLLVFDTLKYRIKV